MKKNLLIVVMTMFCVQGIWAQTVSEEPDSISASQVESDNEVVEGVEPEMPQVNNQKKAVVKAKAKAKSAPRSAEEMAEELESMKIALQELQASVKEDFDPTKPIYKPFYNGKKRRWYQEQSIRFAPSLAMSRNGDIADGSSVGGSVEQQEKFDDAADETASKGSGFALEAGYVRTFIRGDITDQGWRNNRFGVAWNTGFTVSYKSHENEQMFNAFAMAGVEFGHFHRFGIGVNAIFGVGDSRSYVYDLDDPDQSPDPDSEFCFKAGAEVWLRLGLGGAGLIPGVETRLFLRVTYSFVKDNYDEETHLYEFFNEKDVDVGVCFNIPF